MHTCMCLEWFTFPLSACKSHFLEKVLLQVQGQRERSPGPESEEIWILQNQLIPSLERKANILERKAIAIIKLT